MAKKEETVSLIDTFSEFKELKNIDRTTMVSVLEESFRSVIAKMFGTDENYDVIVNPDKGDFEIWRNREVVADDELTNPNMQISLTEARKIDTSYEIGEEVTDEVIFEKFGRRAILNLRQTLASKILELEKDSLYNKYIDKVGTIISAEVYQTWKKEILLLDDEGNELLLPKTEQIPSDFYRKGETVRAVVARVDNKNNNPKIILSRTSPVFLQRLFEQEVPEINDGLITIKRIARIPGERAKIAVESYDERIDPVGACVGVKGSRIHGIVRELRNENIDVINYTSNIQLFIQRALSPAKISSIVMHEEDRKAEVYLKPEEVSLAIGKGGLNIKLASMLTEYTIDVYRELNEEFYSSPRLDNLTSVEACLTGLLSAGRCGKDENTISLIALYDNEEVGSRTKQGAASSAADRIMEKLYLSLGFTREQYLSALFDSFLLSMDVGHAYHPSKTGNYDPKNHTKVNEGVVIKMSSTQSYATDSTAVSVLEELCRAHEIPYRKFSNRSDIRGGSTLGSIFSCELAVRAADVGVGLLAMHSAMETMGACDQDALNRLTTAFFED